MSSFIIKWKRHSSELFVWTAWLAVWPEVSPYHCGIRLVDALTVGRGPLSHIHVCWESNTTTGSGGASDSPSINTVNTLAAWRSVSCQEIGHASKVNTLWHLHRSIKHQGEHFYPKSCLRRNHWLRLKTENVFFFFFLDPNPLQHNVMFESMSASASAVISLIILHADWGANWSRKRRKLQCLH